MPSSVPPPPPASPFAVSSPIMSDVTMSDAEYAMLDPTDSADEETSQLDYSESTMSPSKLAGQQKAGAHRSRFRNEAVSSNARVVQFGKPVDDGTEDEEDNVLQTKPYGTPQHNHHHHPHHQQHQHRRTKPTTAAANRQEYQEQPHTSTVAHKKQHEKSILTKHAEHWMTQLAYSFRSPRQTSRKTPTDRRRDEEHGDNHDDKDARPPAPIRLLPRAVRRESSHRSNEVTPLLPTSASAPKVKALPQDSLVHLAAAFLQDYEAGRPPTFSSNLSVSNRQVALFNIKFSVPFRMLTFAGTMALFVSSGLENFDEDKSRFWLTLLNMFALAVLAVDIWMRHCLSTVQYLDQQQQFRVRSRHSRSERLVLPVILFGCVLLMENIARIIITPTDSLILYSSLLKPIVLFYVSSQARDALEAVRRILRIVVRVLAIELLLILMFAAVACRLFSDFERFANLSTAWLSLFELATTVVNPSIWMPMYEVSKASSLFFIFFIITAVFYLHSLVLSVVFSSYIQAASGIHERSSTDREDAVHLAYVALQQQQHSQTSSAKGVYGPDEEIPHVVDIGLVGETLRLVRPHYNAMKINALLEIVDPSKQNMVNYATFRTKIRQALNASIRTARNATTFAMGIELVAVAIAVVNFCYVILVSSVFDQQWFNAAQERVGVAITLVAGFELAIRFNPLRIPDFNPLTRLNTTFDGLALAAALTSSIGIVMWVFGWPLSLEYILMGRAIDMVRIMRFFQIFRDVVRRSADVLPALTGPVILVVTTLHVFVYAGMALWGGAIHVGSHDSVLTPLYDLNNFNSYQEGVVTMFQVLVVNDWHAIAEVFLYADRCSSPYLVYPFFVIGNLIGVSIMLNVLTAFFVEAFVTKLDDGGPDEAEATTTVQKGRDFNIITAENTSVRRISSRSNLSPMHKLKSHANTKSRQHPGDNDSDYGADADSEGSSESERFEFDVYEREGFDKIMQTVAGGPQSGGENFARHICSYLEIFESLSPGRESVGYLICDQQTLERFGNRRFQTKAVGYLDDNQLHLVVSDMHSELMALSSRPSFDGRSLIRTFSHERDPAKRLEISASILRQHPAVSLFVSRVALKQKKTS